MQRLVSGGGMRRYRDAVDLGDGWNLAPEQQWQLHVLDWLYDRAGGRADEAVAIDPVAIAAPVACGRPVPLQDTFGCLYRSRLVWYVLRHDGPAGMPARAMLTENGVQEMRQIRQRRDNPAARRVAARDALLRWAYERTAAGEHRIMASGFFLSDYARFLSTRADLFSYAEIDGAVAWLSKHGYLHVTSTEAGMVVVIAEKGEHAVENNRSTRDDPPVPPAATSITIAGSHHVTVAAHSPSASQTITAAMTEETRHLLTDLADYLHRHAAQLAVSGDDPRRAAQIVVDLRGAAAEPAPDPTRVQKVLDAVRQIGIGAASVPAGTALLDLVEKAAHALGL